MTAEEWLVVIAALQKQGPVCIAKEDRRFLADMVNVLTLDDPPVVLRWQERWLAALRRECRL